MVPWSAPPVMVSELRRPVNFVKTAQGYVVDFGVNQASGERAMVGVCGEGVGWCGVGQMRGGGG